MMFLFQLLTNFYHLVFIVFFTEKLALNVFRNVSRKLLKMIFVSLSFLLVVPYVALPQHPNVTNILTLHAPYATMKKEAKDSVETLVFSGERKKIGRLYLR
jgi:hypothetical protein